MAESKWIYFVLLPIPLERKTSIWDVRTREGEASLGEIRWFGRWRCFAFYPRADTLYEKQCLRDIADFCEAQTKAHRTLSR
jgi:hypothetical protein